MARFKLNDTVYADGFVWIITDIFPPDSLFNINSEYVYSCWRKTGDDAVVLYFKESDLSVVR